MKYIYTSISLIINLLPIYGQRQGKSLLDSLERKLTITTLDSARFDLIKKISVINMDIDPDLAIIYANKGLVEAKKVNSNKWKGTFYHLKGLVESDKANYADAIKNFNNAIFYGKIANKLSIIGAAYNSIGTVYQRMSKYPLALQYQFSALKIHELQKNNLHISITYQKIATVYFYQENFKKSLEYSIKCQNILDKIGNQEDIADGNINIAEVYMGMKNYPKAKAFYDKALPYFLKTENDMYVARCYTNMALLDTTNFNKIIDYRLKAQKIWDKLSPENYFSIDNLGNLGETLYNLSQHSTKISTILNPDIPKNKKDLLAKAEYYLQKSISYGKKTGDFTNVLIFSKVLTKLQEEKGEHQKALATFHDFYTIQDSLYSQENKNKLASIESEREITIRDNQLKINTLEIESQKKQRIALLIGLGLLAIIGSLLFWQNSIRKKTNITLLHLNNELDEANKIKAKFFAIVSHDLRSPVSNLINFLHLQKESPELLSPELSEKHQKKITESAENLLENMESMLLWSKSQMQHFEPQIKPIKIDTLFDYLQKFFADNTQIDFKFENPDSLTVFSDEDYLKTIMQNLTNNAIKASNNNNTPQIIWKATLQKEQVILSIADNGKGISGEQLKALFSEETIISSKIGLGSYLIRDLAKAISCQISVKSNLGFGSEFQLTFT